MHAQNASTMRQYRLRTQTGLRLGELVAIAPDGQDELRRRRIDLDLAAQVPDQRVDAPLRHERLAAPDRGQQLPARADDARVRRELIEELELVRRHGHVAPAHADGMPSGIQLEVT